MKYCNKILRPQYIDINVNIFKEVYRTFFYMIDVGVFIFGFDMSTGFDPKLVSMGCRPCKIEKRQIWVKNIWEEDI